MCAGKMESRSVLHVIAAAPFGGAQRLAIDLAQAQRRAGLDTTIWYTNAGREAWDAAIEANVAVASPVDGGDSVWRRMKGLSSALRSATVDVVHLHLPPPWLGGSLPLRRKFALIAHLHVQPALKVHRGFNSRLIETIQNRSILSRSDLLISISEWITNEWRSAYPRLKTPSRIVYNGTRIPSDAAICERDGDPTIGMATRLVTGKGVEEYFDLAVRIHQMAPQIRFRIAGDGPMRSEYERLALKRGLDEVISFCGFVKDIAGFWRGIDIAAFTAPFEPFGLRLIEPIAHGVPVVAYRNGTGSDEVIERCRGIVATEYGQLEELAVIAVALTRSRSKRKRLVEAGIADLRRFFSIEKMEAGVRAIYREVCGAPFRDRFGG
jgi:glycosyltransferase involved in cell wall biosynthesis